MRGALFVHLSDIHLHGDRLHPLFDLDSEVRSRLEQDLEQLMGRLGRASGLLISGDIAYSGTTDQYKQARAWIDKLCSIAGCDLGNVWTVPGNHDVDRDTIKNSKQIRLLQENLRQANTELDGQLYETLVKDSAAGEALLRPIEAYNKFASDFRCGISPQMPYWEHRVVLNDNSALIMRGLTSTLVSDETDNERAKRSH